MTSWKAAHSLLPLGTVRDFAHQCSSNSCAVREGVGTPPLLSLPATQSQPPLGSVLSKRSVASAKTLSKEVIDLDMVNKSFMPLRSSLPWLVQSGHRAVLLARVLETSSPAKDTEKKKKGRYQILFPISSAEFPEKLTEFKTFPEDYLHQNAIYGRNAIFALRVWSRSCTAEDLLGQPRLRLTQLTLEQVNEVSDNKILLCVFQSNQANTFSRCWRVLLMATTSFSLLWCTYYTNSVKSHFK